MTPAHGIRGALGPARTGSHFLGARAAPPKPPVLHDLLLEAQPHLLCGWGLPQLADWKEALAPQGSRGGAGVHRRAPGS